MKRFLLLLMAGVVMFLCLIVVLDKKQNHSDNDSTSKITNELSRTNFGAFQRTPALSNNPAEIELKAAISATADPSYARYYLEQVKIDPAFDWKQPINFYGKVVDQMGLPIDGAAVAFVWNDISETGTSETNAASDSQGLFSLVGRRGKGLSIEISKPDYYSSAASRGSFEYANPFQGRFTPSIGNPVVFHLWKKGAVEQLSVKAVRLRISQDGQPVVYDLLTDKASPSGNLEFSFVTGQPDQFFHADMQLRITIKGGGIQAAEGDFPFLAPTEGYQPSAEFNVVKDGKGPFVRQFFIFFNEPRIYGRIQVHIPAYFKSGNSQISFNYWVNHSGSRNLEFDPQALGSP